MRFLWLCACGAPTLLQPQILGFGGLLIGIIRVSRSSFRGSPVVGRPREAKPLTAQIELYLSNLHRLDPLFAPVQG